MYIYISNIYLYGSWRFFLPSQGDSFAGNDVTLIGQVATFAVGGESGIPIKPVVNNGISTTYQLVIARFLVAINSRNYTNYLHPRKLPASDRFGVLNLFSLMSHYWCDVFVFCWVSGI